MAKFHHYERCPKCSDAGRDRRGDNLACYDDGGSHCFSCGFHRVPRGFVSRIKEVNDPKVLPADFTREVPTRAWKWLLQYGLSYTYWTPFVGWSESNQRLMFTVGTPTRFSMGRYIPGGPREFEREPRKWFVYGNCHTEAHVFGDYTDPEKGRQVVLVEDLISAHKIGHVCPTIPLFGTKIFDAVIPTLRHIGLPILMWLDKDQDGHAARRAAQLNVVTGLPVTFTSTDQDPKLLSLSKITQIVNET